MTPPFRCGSHRYDDGVTTYAIRIYGDPVLRKTARRVTSFDDELKRFAKEMVAAMREKDGVGLAAIQLANYAGARRSR